jgi:hypothetical protein
MKQTNKSKHEWVLVVVHSAATHYQIFDDRRPRVRRPRWVRMLVRLYAVGKQVYHLV